MSCLINNGYSLGCKDSLGGVSQVYLSSFSGATSFTYDADDVITGVTNANTFYTFEQRQEQAEFVQTGNHSIENGTNFWEQVVSLIFTKNTADLRNTLKLLSQSTLFVIVKDQNGTYWWIGEQNGADLTASTASAGKAFGDLNGVTVSITAKEPYPARELSAAAFGTLAVI
jgi:hypothetical protein